jgi:HlyD family secretion protein
MAFALLSSPAMSGIRGTEAMDRPVVSAGRRHRWALSLVAVAVVAVLVGLAAGPGIARWARAERSIDIARLRLARVERGEVVRETAVNGRVVAANHPKLYASVGGTVELAVRPGDLVRAGEVLARVDSPELRAELEAGRATDAALRSELGRRRIDARRQAMEAAQRVERLAVQLAAGERELAQLERLESEGLVNQVELARARDAVAIARLDLEQARRAVALDAEAREFELADAAARAEREHLALAELERRVDELAVRAPFDGLVASLHVADRDAVQHHQPLMTIVDLSEFEVTVSIPEVYADDVMPGMDAVVVHGRDELPATVAAVSPEVVGGSVHARVVFDEPPGPGLRQNQRLSVRLVFERQPDVLKVPRGPFFESGGGRTIYVLEEGLLERRAIRTGAVSVSAVEVVAGLEHGDQVVLNDVGAFGGARTLLVRR